MLLTPRNVLRLTRFDIDVRLYGDANHTRTPAGVHLRIEGNWCFPEPLVPPFSVPSLCRLEGSPCWRSNQHPLGSRPVPSRLSGGDCPAACLPVEDVRPDLARDLPAPLRRGRTPGAFWPAYCRPVTFRIAPSLFVSRYSSPSRSTANRTSTRPFGASVARPGRSGCLPPRA